jgi:hypothetical protein
MIEAWAAFALTVGLEWPLLAWLSKASWLRSGVFCLLMNGASWGAAMAAASLWPIPVPALEVAIVVVEAAILQRGWAPSPRIAWLWATLLNLCSWLLGGAIHRHAFPMALDAVLVSWM